MKQLKVGLIGCGSIGALIVEAIRGGEAGNCVVSGLFDADYMALNKLALDTGSPASKSVSELAEKSDLVVECASQQAVREHALGIAGKRDLAILSVGALLDGKLLAELVSRAKSGGTRIYVPSGAICGIDGLKGAAVGGLDEVTLTTTKPAASLGVGGKERKTVFSGSPEEAVKKFPASINVSAAIRLSVGKAPVTVKIVADPKATLNTHEIFARGKFGRMHCRSENLPSRNPKTSALAAFSAVALIRRLTQTLVVGT